LYEKFQGGMISPAASFSDHALRGLLALILVLLEGESLVQFLVKGLLPLRRWIDQIKSIQEFVMSHFWRKEEDQ
jgi:hypothetical protein